MALALLVPAQQAAQCARGGGQTPNRSWRNRFEILDFCVLARAERSDSGPSVRDSNVYAGNHPGTILGYANDAVQTVHDNQLRAIARATLWVSIVILVVSCRGAGAALVPLIPDRMVTPNAPSGQPPIDERGM